jgi:hypothetical protein
MVGCSVLRSVGIFLIFLTLSAAADTVEIASPDRVQTYAYSEARYKSLEWDEDEQTLIAYMTFSTRPYAYSNEPPKDEFCSFRFPGVTFDPANQKYYAKSNSGRKIPIAEQKEGLISDWVEMLPGTAVLIFKKDGDVKVVLAATTDWKEGDPDFHWIERNEGWFLKNLIQKP